MSNFETLFDSFYNSVKTSSGEYALTKSAKNRSLAIHGSALDIPKGPQDEYLLQRNIRPCFGKIGLNETPIGTHPDFINLESLDNRTQHHYICTLFVDIKGSTRLSLLYPLELVYDFKNAVLKTCIEIIRSFDGYVHRLMGDAVMAFFGGKKIEKENAIADTINCSITIRAILEESIKPWMERKGFDSKDFGFRIGCDFGDDQDVLWGNFGYQNVGEVSATGLPVDMASKLQHLANKNQTMIGQGVLEYINWPEKYSELKTKTIGDTSKTLPVVIPNITDSEGNPINYNMRLLAYQNCIEFSALPRNVREQICPSQVKANPAIEYKCYTIIDGEKLEYISASRFLNKSVSLEFEVKANTRTRLEFPLEVKFIKTNHGKETPEDERDVPYPPTIKYLKKIKSGAYNKAPLHFSTVTIPEYTAYRGLHTMRCEIKNRNGALIFKDRIGVMIK